MMLNETVVPWALLASVIPLLAGLGGLAMPGRRSLWSAAGLAGLWAVVLRVLLGYDFRSSGVQFATELPGLVVGIDGWSAAALATGAGCMTISATMRWSTSSTLPGLLLAAGAGAGALVAQDLGVVLLAGVGGLAALGGLGGLEIILAAVALAGLVSVDSAAVAFPLLAAGLGGLALRGPRDDASALLAWVGLLMPALLLAFPRLLLPQVADGALLWSQATAPVAAAVVVWGALRALGAASLLRMAGGLATMSGAVVLVAWHAVRLDAWNGGALLAVWLGPLLGLLLTLEADPAARFARLRGRPRRAGLAALVGLGLAGLPATPGFPALLLVSLGSWQSQWRHAPWWFIATLAAVWLGAFAPLRAAAAMRRGQGEAPPLGWRPLLLAAATVTVGLAPRLLVDLIDHASAERIRAMSPALERLVSGELRPLLPAFLQGWWL